MRAMGRADLACTSPSIGFLLSPSARIAIRGPSARRAPLFRLGRVLLAIHSLFEKKSQPASGAPLSEQLYPIILAQAVLVTLFNREGTRCSSGGSGPSGPTSAKGHFR